MSLTFPEIKIYNRTTETFYDSVTPIEGSAGEYECSASLPPNITREDMIYTFEVYLNGNATGITSIVTVSAMDEETEIQVLEFYADQEILPATGGTVKFTIKLQTV